jgi:hypothetical protein
MMAKCRRFCPSTMRYGAKLTGKWSCRLAEEVSARREMDMTPDFADFTSQKGIALAITVIGVIVPVAARNANRTHRAGKTLLSILREWGEMDHYRLVIEFNDGAWEIEISAPSYGQRATRGVGSPAIQAYLGNRNIQNTTRYTALAPKRFKEFFRD